VAPVRVGREGRLVGEKGEASVAVDGGETPGDGCVEIGASGAALRLRGLPHPARGRLTLATCEPRAERTPVAVETNAIEIR